MSVKFWLPIGSVNIQSMLTLGELASACLTLTALLETDFIKVASQ